MREGTCRSILMRESRTAPAIIALALCTLGVVSGLECWSCIADDCHLDPATNYKATKVTCNEDFASCQKVEYVGRDSPTKEEYASVVRSCSQGECLPHTDNCSHALKTNPGCMVRHCCHTHLCNSAPCLAPATLTPATLLISGILLALLGTL